ncbi:hypothetical protein MMC19_000337, partial [Ptychographa xylographoides]|nr:hypothetical protein [Ptychographa xylographoides]
MSISAPMSTPFDYEKLAPIPPWQNPYSTHAPQPVPIPPPKRTVTKSTYIPKRVPIFDANWRDAPPSPRFVAQEMATKAESPISPSKKWLRLSPTMRQKLFRNAGTDERGRLKLDFEELEDTDWGEPDEYFSSRKS